MLRNTEYHQENQMVAELNIIFLSMTDEVLNGVYVLVEHHAESPPVKAVQE